MVNRPTNQYVDRSAQALGIGMIALSFLAAWKRWDKTAAGLIASGGLALYLGSRETNTPPPVTVATKLRDQVWGSCRPNLTDADITQVKCYLRVELGGHAYRMIQHLERNAGDTWGSKLQEAQTEMARQVEHLVIDGDYNIVWGLVAWRKDGQTFDIDGWECSHQDGTRNYGTIPGVGSKLSPETLRLVLTRFELELELLDAVSTSSWCEWSTSPP